MKNNKSWCADRHLATALQGRCVRNRVKQPQSNAVEESSVPDVCSFQFLHGHSREAHNLNVFFNFQVGSNSDVVLQNAYIHVIFSCVVMLIPLL